MSGLDARSAAQDRGDAASGDTRRGDGGSAGGRLPAHLAPDELAHRVARTAVALLHHDDACRDYACLMRDGCPERQALMEAHNEATNDYEEAVSRV